MKKFFLCAVIGLIFVCSGCVSGGLQRGFDASGTFISTGRPPIKITPSQDFSKVDCFSTSVSLIFEKGIVNTVTANADCALYRSGNKQLVAVIADIHDRVIWDVSDQSAEYAKKNTIFELRSDKTESPAVTVYTRPLQADPWQTVFNIKGKKPEDEILITRFEWICNADQTKVIIEYREPLDQNEIESIRHKTYDVQELHKRANASFSISKLTDAKAVVLSPKKHLNISDRTLSKVLGGTCKPPVMSIMQ